MKLSPALVLMGCCVAGCGGGAGGGAGALCADDSDCATGLVCDPGALVCDTPGGDAALFSDAAILSDSAVSDSAVSSDAAAMTDSGSPPVCGDGALQAPEECDATDFGTATCATRGFDGGALSCTGACTIDDGGCSLGFGYHGDVNGDGYADVVAGADAAGGTGTVSIWFGGPAPFDTTADLTLTGEAAGDAFGTAVALPGDVNGDGYDDVLVGAPFADAGGTDAGRAYLFYGGPGGPVDLGGDVVFTGEGAGDELGADVNGAQDVNGDAFPDLVLGAPGNDLYSADAGAAYVHFGGPGMDTLPEATLLGGPSAFGRRVSSAGDGDGDGYADVVVADGDCCGLGLGNVSLYRGGPGSTFDASADWGNGTALSGPADVASAGDLDGAGLDDILIGDAFNDADSGALWIPLSVGSTYVTGACDPITAAEQMGFAVSGAGDIDGDALPDVIFGAPGGCGGGGGVGTLFGPYSPAGGCGGGLGCGLVPSSPGDQAGHAVGSAGDVDGDGFGDVVVGAPFNDDGGSDAGVVFLRLGSSSGLATLYTLTGAAGDHLGISVASAF